MTNYPSGMAKENMVIPDGYFVIPNGYRSSLRDDCKDDLKDDAIYLEGHVKGYSPGHRNVFLCLSSA